MTTNYNDGLWHGWNGGECPVHPETVVEVALNDTKPCEDHAEQWFWDLGRTRIIAFRVIKEHKEPREWWIARDKDDGREVLFKSEQDANKHGWKNDARTDVIRVVEAPTQ